MKKRFAAILLGVVLTFSTVAVIAPVPSAEAAITYECRKYHWLFGWHKIYTTSYSKVAELQRNGYTCYCIG